MNAQFRAGDYDGGITSAVSGALNVYRSHLNALSGGSSVATRTAPAQQPAQGGVHISVFWWIIIALFAFFILRSIMRAMSGPRSYGGGPGYGAGGPGYGGYGGGYGWGGGGGFWSGMLGGLGGAFLGNELFGRGGWGGGGFGGGADQNAGNVAPSDGGGWHPIRAKPTWAPAPAAIGAAAASAAAVTSAEAAAASAAAEETPAAAGDLSPSTGSGSFDRLTMTFKVRPGKQAYETPAFFAFILRVRAACRCVRRLAPAVTYVHGVATSDPLTFAVVVTLLTLVALAATAMPARRAVHIEPVTALRQ